MTVELPHEESHELELALVALGLPISTADLPSALDALNEHLDRVGTPRLDRAETVTLWTTSWRDGHPPTAELRAAIRAVLSAAGGAYARRLADTYFTQHTALREAAHLSFSQATTILGYAELIGRLAEQEQMSAAQIAVILQARGVSRVAATWTAVQKVLGALNLAPRLGADRAARQLALDLQAEEVWFADARRPESIDLVSRTASALGFPDSMDEQLSALVPEDAQDTHWPYVAMLHFACLPLEWYDHAPAFAYEFSPRGRAANLVFENYRNVGLQGNPYLNNAKSVDRMDVHWADSKGGLRPSATALVRLLDGLGSMPYQAKRRLAALLRQWCLRQLRLCSRPPRLLDRTLFTREVIQRVMEKVAELETHTLGILEQRLVDAIAAWYHSDPSWRARGLGDAVNAANLPRRKLGDCEFQNPSSKTVHAYEAHGGTLNNLYIDNHLASLSRVVAARVEDEWKSFSEPNEWSVSVTFLCHNTGGVAGRELTLHDVQVRILCMRYQDFFPLYVTEELKEFFHDHVLVPLNDSRTPQSIRDRLMELAELT